MIVSPAPGVPAAVPFWKGDGLGRPRELGEAIGAFARWAVDQDPKTLALKPKIFWAVGREPDRTIRR